MATAFERNDRFRDPAGCERRLLIGIGAAMAAMAIQLAALAWQLHGATLTAPDGFVTVRADIPGTGVVGVIIVLTQLAWLATIVLWLAWQYRGQENLWAAGVPHLRFSPAWAVLWWFVPVADLAAPFATVRELARASRSDGQAGRWRDADTPWAMYPWWGTFVISVVVYAVGFAVRSVPVPPGSVPAPGDVWSATHASDVLLIIADVAGILAGAAAVMVVRGVGRAQATLPAVVASPPATIMGLLGPPRPDLPR